MLECEDCGATWRVEFPSSLVQGRAARRLTELYETELSSKHRDAAACRHYGTEARLYREEQMTEVSTVSLAVWERRLLPNAFLPIVSRATRLLLNDSVRCRERFQCRYDAVLRALTESLPSENHQWSWSLPDAVRYYRPEEDEDVLRPDRDSTTNGPFVASGQSNLLVRILEAVSRVERSSDGSFPGLGSLEQLSVALVLMGWSESLLEQNKDVSIPAALKTPGTTAGTARDPRRSSWCLTCPFTLSVLMLMAIDKQDPSDASRTAVEENAKNDVYRAHRYYSPYVCGFPITARSSVELSQPAVSALPIWKSLAARLLHAPASAGIRASGKDVKTETSEGVAMEPYEAYEQALSVLRSTVSPRFKRQRVNT